MIHIAKSLSEAIKNSGLKDGMTISFHHHLRSGDFVGNMVMDEINKAGFKNITINASSLLDIHLPLLTYIKNGTFTKIETNYIGPILGQELTKGILGNPIVFRTHGGRVKDIKEGNSIIDIAFIAASAVDSEGNATGKIGKSAFGGIGYAIADAQYAKHKIVITDTLLDYKLKDPSIPSSIIDQVVLVDKIGDPNAIVSSTTKITTSPLRLKIAQDTVSIISSLEMIKPGFTFQTGAGGTSLAVSRFLKAAMLEKKVKGDFCLGGITKYMVDMLKIGCFERILDAQCFDTEAVKSLNIDPNHKEISCEEYAAPYPESYVNKLDVAVLGATEIDFNFNVNVHTSSFGHIMGGSGGHTDASAGSKLTIIVAPLLRGRIPLIKEHVTTISTPGKDIDILVTEFGMSVNPLRNDLKDRLKNNGIPEISIYDQFEFASKLIGNISPVQFGNKIVGKVLYRNSEILDNIYNTI